MQPGTNPQHAPFSGRASPDVTRNGISILQLNVEGLTKAKTSVIEHIIQTHKPTAILLQETHVKDPSRLKISGFTLVAHTESDTHGIATFIQNSAKWNAVASCPPDSSLEWTATSVEGVTVTNVYKPPSFRLQADSIPSFAPPCIYAGDFNCRSTTWGYNSTNHDGAALEDWASATGVQLIYDPKEPDSFHSGRWNTSTNPDLAFSNINDALPNRTILDHFPRSQHRPSMITPENPIEPIKTKPLKRWNFRKARWDQFTNQVELGVVNLPTPSSSNLDQAYTSLCNLLTTAAKSSIPRGHRRCFIPSWDDECNTLYNDFLEAERGDEATSKATLLTACLDNKRRERWEETVKGIDFTHSSRLAWKTLNRLTGRSSKPKKCPVTANSIAEQLLENGRFKDADKDHNRHIKQETSKLWQAPGVDGHLSSPFSPDEIASAIKHLKSGKAQGPDNLPPEFLLHCGPKCLEWLRLLFSTCLTHQSIPKIWRKASIIALPKPNKPLDNPKNYRPISLLCIPFKLLERLLLARLEPIVDPQLPDEQAGFRRGRSTVQQVVLLTNDIENSFERGHKAGAVLVDLTAAYDTVWHQGLTLKLLQMVPDRHLVGFISNILSNRSFVLKTSDGQSSRPRRLKNGLPQGSVMAPTLFNIYISDMPKTTAQQYGYADDLALFHSDIDWLTVEDALTSDMAKIANYLKTWRLKLSTAKTTATAFHLNTKEANRQLSVNVNGNPLPHTPTPTYLGVKLDRQLTFKPHLDSLRAKVSARNNLLRRLAGTTWGARAPTLRTGALALVYSAAEYAAPAWCRSSHTPKLDTTLNETMRIITGCLRSTPTDLLPVLAGIAPPSIRREHYTQQLVNKALQERTHPLHQTIQNTQPERQRLRSRRPFSRHADTLREGTHNTLTAWKDSWQQTPRPPQFTVTPNTKLPPGADLPRKDWVTLNRLRSGVGRFHANMHRWGLRTSPACTCGAPEQTASHIIKECPTLRPPGHPNPDLNNLDPDTVLWLQNLRDVA